MFFKKKNFHSWTKKKRSHLITNTVGIQIPTSKRKVLIASLVQICTYANLEKMQIDGRIRQEDILSHPRI